jgi:hypothetical protein
MTGRAKPPPSPHGGPPVNHFGTFLKKHLSQKYKQNIGRKKKLKGRFDILVSELSFVNLMSYEKS